MSDALTNTPPGAEVDGAFFPHYAPGDIPIEGEGGGVLAPIGPDWVLTPEYYAVVYMPNWPNLDPQVEIPCN